MHRDRVPDSTKKIEIAKKKRSDNDTSPTIFPSEESQEVERPLAISKVNNNINKPIKIKTDFFTDINNNIPNNQSFNVNDYKFDADNYFSSNSDLNELN
jgi:hypothetical protein